jgi:chromatin remodeling complex protein RSC6
MPVKTAKKTKSSKKSTKKSKKKVEAPVEEVEEVEEAPVEEVEEAPVEEAQPKRTRRVVDRESVVRDFDSLLQTLEDHVEELRSSSNNKTRKNTGVKFVKSVTKSLRTLKKDTVKAMKMKRKTNRAKNATSGFMKPVKISDEMIKFTGWDADAPKSRVDVTKFICNYIKEKDLQKPEDRRVILPDSKLKKILKYEEGDNLTYYSLQQKIQHHFKK